MKKHLKVVALAGRNQDVQPLKAQLKAIVYWGKRMGLRPPDRIESSTTGINLIWWFPPDEYMALWVSLMGEPRWFLKLSPARMQHLMSLLYSLMIPGWEA